MLAVFPNSSSHYALRQALSMNLEHLDMASLARFAPSPRTKYWIYRQVAAFSWHVSYGDLLVLMPTIGTSKHIAS